MATSGTFTCRDPPRSPEGPGIAGSGDYEESPDTSLHCVWITTSTPTDTLAVLDHYIRGMHWFYWEDFDQSYDELEPIAAIPDTVRSGLSMKCRQYIDVSRVMVDVLDSLVSDRSLLSDSPVSPDVTSVHETTNTTALSIYPNPAMGSVNIRPGTETTLVRIANAWGQEMKEIHTGSSKISISLEDWPDGIYVIMGMAKTGRSYRRRSWFYLAN